MDVWMEAMAEHGLDPAFYLRRRPLAEVLPWDHLDAGVSRRFLLQDLAPAVSGVLTPDCSIERCTWCGACDFTRVRNVDYHPAGAKGADHRGGEISRWAELAVPGDDAGPAWETKAWRELRSRTRPRSPRLPVPAEVPPPAPIVPRDAHTAPRVPRATAGDGNAEEWLGAVPSSLTPEPDAAAPCQRIRLRYRKVGPARFIGTREIGTVFLRAARRAALPLAFSRGHHPMPRLSFSPAIPLGFSSDDEYVDLDLTAPLAPEAVVARLGAELPDGLEPLAAVEVPRSGPSIDAGIAAFVYEVDLADLDEPPAPERVADAVARFARAAAFPIRKRGRSGDRTVDARRFVHALAQAGPQRLTLELAVGPDGTVKPGALLGELLAIPPDVIPALRVHKLATRFREAAAA